jgi:hypothetical protein
MSDDGNIYVIACQHPFSVKIGFTRRDPAIRLAQLQTGCPSPLALVGWFPGTLEEERAYHEDLKEHRLAGEWFHICEANERAFSGLFTLVQINNILSGHDPLGGA